MVVIDTPFLFLAFSNFLKSTGPSIERRQISRGPVLSQGLALSKILPLAPVHLGGQLI